MTVWTARTHTLQDSWRPVPGLDLDATFGAGDAPRGGWSASAASRAVAADLLAPAEPRLGESEESDETRESESRLGDFPFDPPRFFVYHDIYRLYEPVAKCAQDNQSGGDLDSLRVASEIAFFNSLLHHPWRTMKPCSASVFVVPALPLAELHQKDECAPADRSPERLRKMVLATLGKSKHFAANAGRDHFLFSAEMEPRAPNVPGTVPSLGLEKTVRNFIAARPGLGLAGWKRNSSDAFDWLVAPSASSRRVKAMRGVAKDVDLVVVPLHANEAEMNRLVNVARRRETTLVVTPARFATMATTTTAATGRRLLAETEPWPASQQRQYYVFREDPSSASAAREFKPSKARLGTDSAPRILTAEEREAAIRRAAKEVEKTSRAKRGKNASREPNAKEDAVEPVTTTSRLLPTMPPGRWRPAPGLRDSSGSPTRFSGASRGVPAGTWSSAASRPAANVAARSGLPAGAWSSAARNDPRRFEAAAREAATSTARRRVANGRGRVLKASLGADSAADLRALDGPSRRAREWWASKFAEPAATLGEREKRAPRLAEKVTTTDATSAFSRANYCVVVTSRGMDDSAAAAAVADAVAAECVPVLVADAYPTAIPAVNWDSFVALVPRDAWEEDAARALDLVMQKYRDPLEEGTAGWKKLDALRSAAPDLLWQHPESRVIDNLLISVAKRSEEKFKTTTRSGRKSRAACEKNEGEGAGVGAGAQLPELGAAAPARSKWARRAAMDEDASGAWRAIGEKIARLGMEGDAAELEALYGDDVSLDAPIAGEEDDDVTVDASMAAEDAAASTEPKKSKRAKRRRRDSDSPSPTEPANDSSGELLDELMIDEEEKKAHDSDPDALLEELTAPSKPTVVGDVPDVDASSEEKQDISFDLPVDLGGSVTPPVEEDAVDGVPADPDAMDLGGSVTPPADDDVVDGVPADAAAADGPTALDVAAAAATADLQSKSGTAAAAAAATDAGSDSGTTVEVAAAETNPEDLESASQTANETSDFDDVAKTPEEKIANAFLEPAETELPSASASASASASESNVVVAAPSVAAPSVDAPSVAATETMDFAAQIAEALRATRDDEAEDASSRAMVRSIADEMRRSLGLDARDGADSFEAGMGSREAREELMAMRVAELLRPAMGHREASGLEKLASGDHPLVEINVNTNNKGMETDKLKKAKRPKSHDDDDDDDDDARLERRERREDHREARREDREHREHRDSRKVKRYERLLDELDARVPHAGEARVESRESRARAEKERRLDDLLRAASEAAEKAEEKADELREAEDAVEHVSTDSVFDSDSSYDALDEALPARMERVMALRERRRGEDALEEENPFMKRLADGVARWNAEHGVETSQPAWAAGRAAQAAAERHEEHRRLRPQSSTETSETLSRLEEELRGFDVDVPDAKAEYDATLGQLDIDDDRDEGSAWDLDEVPEVDGIDGVIETAEAMGKVWAARQKLDAEAEAAEVAKKTKTRDVEPGLKLNRGREAYEKSAKRGNGADVGSGKKPRGAIGNLLDELGVGK